MLTGRAEKKKILQNALTEENYQLIAVYGRHRVGKTFLIRETYGNKFCSQFTGAAKINNRKQLARFCLSLKRQGLDDVQPLTNCILAYSEVARFIEMQAEGKKVIFCQELSFTRRQAASLTRRFVSLKSW